MSKNIAFESAIEFYGGPELLAAYRGMASDMEQSANEAVGEAVLRKIAVAIADAVISVPTLTDTDQKPGSKTPGERWWYYRHPTGTQRQKVASAIQTIPLGSKQDRHFVGRRLAIVGQSGQFYGRLIERGFKVKYFYGEKIKNPKEVPGKWPMSRAFRKLRPEMQLEAIRQFADLIDSLGVKRITPRIPLMPQTVWNIETAVWDKIDATSAITALVGKGNSSRAFPEVPLDGAVRPCIVYELASSRPFQTLSGSPTLVFSTIAIHCMGDTKIQAVNLARKVQDAFQDWSGTWYDGATLKLTVSGGRTSTITTDYLAPTDGATYGLFVSTVEVTCFHTN